MKYVVDGYPVNANKDTIILTTLHNIIGKEKNKLLGTNEDVHNINVVVKDKLWTEDKLREKLLQYIPLEGDNEEALIQWEEKIYATYKKVRPYIKYLSLCKCFINKIKEKIKQ